MKITKDEIMHVTKLARINPDNEAIDKLARQIGMILEYVDTLNKAETKGVPPTSHAVYLTNAFRKDLELKHLDRDQALANAPEKEDGNFMVPKVI